MAEDALAKDKAAWLILAFQLPPQPGYLRVKVWRQLQSVGAVSFRNAVYVLPRSEDIGREDRGLKAIAQIVHDLDLKVRRYEREETAGVRQILSGIIASHARDEDRLDRGHTLFDELYRSFTSSR